ATEETLRRELRGHLQQMNTLKSIHSRLLERRKLADDSLAILKKEIFFGKNPDLNLMAEAFQEQIRTRSAIFQSSYRVLILKDRLNRMTFHEAYAAPTALVERRVTP